MISQGPLTLSRFYRETYCPMKPLGRSAAYMAILAETPKRNGGKRTPSTVNHARRLVLAVIKCAREHELAHPSWDKLSAKVSRLPEFHDDPEAYLKEEIEALVKAAQRWRPRKRIAGILVRRFWPALILTKFATGVRIGALMAARFENLDFNGRALVIRGITQKTNKGRRFKLIPEAVCALREMGERPKRELVFPWPYDQGNRQWPTLTRHFREIIQAVGLKQDEHPFHKIRRSCASYTAAIGGKILAQQQMGHASLSTTEVYFDPRIVVVPQAADVLPELKVSFKKK